ncbi:DSBA-like thioredoxin domain protein [Candidatus Izimaplasma bacterium HR1]|jgi:predicted DsbA family dithiol-disulfide isomerase|uniref:DsbA family oxidoreductase n=1 Tax=Candidatus Izimoplasma sp. HR1 TaxID=1541959 RepID=UPI0004F5D9AA|nr:DSBA-like thioredoxin domain protein [Candidatus Izimaplasma bacterium HR1]
MKVELWSDFACPFCYIGKKRFEKALENFPHKDKIEVVYKAYQLNPNAPKVMKGSPVESFAKGHRMSTDTAKQRFTMFNEQAQSVGLSYDYENIQMTNSFDAHRLAKWANQFDKEQMITERLMKAYFTDGLNIADIDTLVTIAGEVGLSEEDSRKVLESKKYSDQVYNEINEGKQIGVQGVPFFVLNRKYGISGAQPIEYFTQSLEKLWEEEKPLEDLSGADEGHTCSDESCSI